MKILVTGGTGYIGSHTCVELLQKGHEVVVFDNLCNSKRDVLDKVREITGKEVIFYKADMRDKESMRPVFEEHTLDAVIHFAGLKAVGESVAKPLLYYQNNITGTLNLCELMNEYQCRRIIFSSSATVYGSPETVPIREDFPLRTTNPYGSTKLMQEGILSDLCVPDREWSVVLLRYFNPIGAHESGLLGESPNGIPNNLMPYIMQVALGKLPELGVFGDDYDTPDGTGVRDYIHVVDLARGHVNAIEKAVSSSIYIIWELGGGTAYWRSSGHLKRPAALRFRIPSSPGEQETSPPPMPIRGRRRRSLAGRQNTIWTECARIPGDLQRKIFNILIYIFRR